MAAEGNLNTSRAAYQIQDSSMGDAEAAEGAARGQHLAIVQKLQARAGHRVDAAYSLGVLRQMPRCIVEKSNFGRCQVLCPSHRHAISAHTRQQMQDQLACCGHGCVPDALYACSIATQVTLHKMKQHSICIDHWRQR